MSLSSKGTRPDGVEGVVEASLASSQHVDVAVEAEAVMTSPNSTASLPENNPELSDSPLSHPKALPHPPLATTSTYADLQQPPASTIHQPPYDTTEASSSAANAPQLQSPNQRATSAPQLLSATQWANLTPQRTHPHLKIHIQATISIPPSGYSPDT